MKVLYDYQIFQMQNFGGISRYFYELMKNSKSDNYELAVLMSANEQLSEEVKVARSLRIPIKHYTRAYRFSHFFNKQYSSLKIRNSDFDILHPTFYEDYFLNSIKRPFVLTVHDLINERYPQYFSKNDEFITRKKRLMDRAEKILAVSENTKKDIVEYFNFDASKIEVTHLAESLSGLTSRQIKGLPHRYVLFVGKREGYKNFNNFYQAMKPILLSNDETHIVCAGGGGFNTEELKTFTRDGTLKKVRYVPFSKSEELKYMYENAACFVFPSLYEGFGIPVLESFASGCPVCTSNTSSLKEISGGAAILFDPQSLEEINAAILKALSLTKKNELVTSGFKELEKYSWQKTTEKTLAVYKKCL